MIEAKQRGYFGAGVTQAQADLLNAALSVLTEAGVVFDEMQANSGYERYIHSDSAVIELLKPIHAVHKSLASNQIHGQMYLVELSKKATLVIRESQGKFAFSGSIFTNKSIKQMLKYYDCSEFEQI